MSDELYAEIIIPLALPKNYTWSIPEELTSKLQVGCRVEVGLGKNKKYAGIVKRIHSEIPSFDTKAVLNVLDTEPIVFREQLVFWEWMAAYYMCSEGEVMQAAMPTYFKLSSHTTLLFNEEYGEDFSDLDDDEFLVAEALLLKKELKIPEVQQILDNAHTYPVVKRLIDKKVCLVWEELKNEYKEKKENFVLLNPKFSDEKELEKLMNNWSKAPRQMELLLAFLHYQKTEGEVSQVKLLQKANASLAQLKGLIEKDVLRTEKRSVDRIRYMPKQISLDFELSKMQEDALESVNSFFQHKAVCLLHGVTSSGKTMLYMKLMAEQVSRGKQVLYLLPEIALTSQVIRRLQKYFGGYITVYHSKFNQNEKVEIWNKVKSGEAKIVVGARSSLFLPFSEPGLIICDEEHETSFKQQEPAPRYHARDSAIYFASLFNAKVLLGSATPSVESYANALAGKYGLVELTERFGAIKMPMIELIDTKKFMSQKVKVMISPVLKEAIERDVARGKQIILFQNRRGYSPYQICLTCGWIPQCKYCDVSLAFHKLLNKLQCHYCGTVYPTITTCDACGNHQFGQFNFGTERIEEELQEQFPHMRIGRMDVDTVKGKNAHDNIIQLFEQKRLDILVGTQMVVKGLDFDNVSLVGILDGDALLGFTDFRVNERAFQLMEQVSGRSGRKDEQGHVLIQLKNTAHPVLTWVQHHDYRKFYDEELEKRRQYFYPPFSRVIQVTFRHKNNQIVHQAATLFASMIGEQFGKYMVGPAEPLVNRVRNLYLMELMIKLPKDAALIKSCKE
ncbi:MAG: primosomal protein N', partial [Chitinophagaceae bacterium]